MNINYEKLFLNDIFEDCGMNAMLEQIKPFKPGFTDEQLADIPDWKISSLSYGINNFSFSGTERNWEIKNNLLKRLESLEKKPILQNTKPKELFECTSCGVVTSIIFRMISSSGSVCADCYDECSN